MDSTTLFRLRPADNSADAIRDALAMVQAERDNAARRTATLSAERTKLLLTATTSAIARAEAGIREIATDQEQLDAIKGALLPLLEAAEAKEADAERARQIQDAAAATMTFNIWLAGEYMVLATAIARGIDLETKATRLREALRDRRTGHMPDGLPALSRAFVGSDSRSLEFLTRLPGIASGSAAPVWPR